VSEGQVKKEKVYRMSLNATVERGQRGHMDVSLLSKPVKSVYSALS